MTLSITTFSITTFCIMTLSRKGLFGTLSINDFQHEWHLAYYYAEYCNLFNVMLNVVMLRTNTLAYLGVAWTTKRKKFIKLTPSKNNNEVIFEILN